MKKAAQIGKVLAVGLVSFVVVAVVAGVVWWARIPRYDGQTVQFWFARAEEQWMGNVTPGEMQLVEHAFQEMGAEAIPFLLDKFTRVDISQDHRRAELYFWVTSKKWIPQSVKDLVPRPFMRNEQMAAYELLSAMGDKAIVAQSTLEEVLGRPGPLNEYLDHQVLGLFAKMGEQASNSAPVIARCFVSTNDSIDSSALRAFHAITPKGSPHARLLREALAGEKIRAASALPRFQKWELPIEEFLPKLGEELCSTNGAIHTDALSAIKGLKVRKEVLVPYFGKAMTDPDPRFRAELLQEVRSIGTAAADAVPAVLSALDDAYSYVRVEAVRTLLAVHPDAQNDAEIIAKLESKLRDSNEHVVEAVQAALEDLEGRKGAAGGVRE